MTHPAIFRSALLVVLTLLVTGLAATGALAGWNSSRDAAMSQREAGNAEKAYATVINASASKAADVTDRHFLAGYLALRSLGRADLALKHFQDMATSTSSLGKSERSNGRATAGYWLGRTLVALGKNTEAQTMYSAAAAYRDTFYGQMAASQLGLKDTSAVLTSYRNLYPDMEIFWHDPRVRRELVLAIIRAESSFRQNVKSSAGAKGLMQVMDGTALRVGRSSGVDIDLSLVASNGHYNVAVGSKLVGDLLARYSGNVLLMAAGYNAGEGKADEWIDRFGDPRSGQIDPVDWIELIPFKESRDYVKRVTSNYVTYIAIAAAGI